MAWRLNVRFGAGAANQSESTSCSGSSSTNTLGSQSQSGSTSQSQSEAPDSQSESGSHSTSSSYSQSQSGTSRSNRSRSSAVSSPLANLRANRTVDKTKDFAIKGGRAKEAGSNVGDGCQRLVLMRHAERVDRVFPQWCKLAFYNGQYRPYDLNQLAKLPSRRTGSQMDFQTDPPITEIGTMTSQMIGRGLSLVGSVPTVVYSSPALRCVQTALAVLNGLQGPNLPQLRIEPGLFEWMAWYEQPPNWFGAEQLADVLHSAQIDRRYQPLISGDRLRKHLRKESSQEYMQRTNDLINRILKTEPPSARVLIVGHASTLDASRQLLARTKFNAPLPREEMDRMGLNYPYCATVMLDKDQDKTQDKWSLSKQTLPAITYMDFSSRINHDFFNR